MSISGRLESCVATGSGSISLYKMANWRRQIRSKNHSNINNNRFRSLFIFRLFFSLPDSVWRVNREPWCSSSGWVLWRLVQLNKDMFMCRDSKFISGVTCTFLSRGQNLLESCPPNHVLSALQCLASREQQELEEKLSALDVTRDVRALRWADGGHF